MALARITGPMLQSNLERQGTNISIDAAAYFDVTNYRLGVNKSVPAYTLDISGNAHLGNLYILGNTITTDSGYKLNLGNIANVVITGGSANTIVYTDGNGNLKFGNLAQLSAIEGFFGNNISLGTNSVGALGNGAVNLSNTTTITDSIAALNQALGNITSSGTGGISTSGNLSVGNANISGNTISGNITANNTIIANNANILGNISANYFIGNATYMTGLPATYSNANVSSYLPVYSANISAGNIAVTGKYYGNVVVDVITPYLTTVTTFNSTAAIGLPVGSNVQYPTSNAAGYLRYNNTISTLEFYNGSNWITITNNITDQVITPDGINQSFALTQFTTAAGILVSINGTVQRPGTAYTVSGTTITFTEIPLTTDIIDVRYIANSVTANLDFVVVDTANIVVGTANVIIDSFSSTQYRSAKYTISSTNPYDSQFAEIMLVQNAGVTTVNTIGNVRTGANLITYYANINSGTVNLLANSSTSQNQLRIQRTYFNI